ncbi:MAG: type II secretion system F family protein [Candidatus Aenigmatarchaeota archaeon]
MDVETKIIIVSGVIFLLLLFLAFYFSSNFAIAVNLIFLGIIIFVVPFSIYRFFEFKKIKAYELVFPNFLRDLAESQRAGLTLIQAIQAVEKSDYGPLTKEIHKMNNQLSWNIPLEKVLENFKKRMKKSKIITRSLTIIEQANKSGGNIEDTMDSLASNIESLKDVQAEKNLLMNQQVLMMYAIFFIFLGISIALIKFLVPMLQTQAQTGGFGLGFNANPCSICLERQDQACIGCDIFFAISEVFDFGTRDDPGAYYKSLFFAMILIQGLFSGLIAGQIGSDSVIAGVKHSLLMLLSGLFIYMFVIKMGII